MKKFIRTASAASLALAATQTAGFAQQVHFNEMYVSHSGTDFYEYIELIGAPGTSLDNYVVCVVEGDYGTTGSEPGKLDRAWDLTGYSIPLDGYFVLGDTNLAMGMGGTCACPPDFDIGAQDRIENGTDTIYLVNCGSPANTAALVAQINTDIDAANAPDDDLITTIPTLGTIEDIVGLVDCGYYYIYNTGTCSPNAALDRVYDGAPIMPIDGVCADPASANPPLTSCQQGGFLPGGIFRGLDYPAPWCSDLLDFNEVANQFEPRTPGAQNSVCPSAVSVLSYCTAGTTTNGCNATMGYTGIPSIALGAGGFFVNCATIEGQKTGLIFYSISGQNATSWGTGTSFLCVKSPQQRTQSNNSNGTTNMCDGSLSLDFFQYVTVTNPSALGTPFSAGSQAWFQTWFRDPPAPKTTSLSDGLEVTFMP